MTSTTIRAPGHDTGPLDDDLRGLADQLQRCLHGRGRWPGRHAVLERLRAFTVTHVALVAVAAALAGGLWWLIR